MTPLEMRSYIETHLRCPVELYRIEQEAQVGQNLATWVSENEIVKGSVGLERFIAYKTERAICSSMPYASTEVLQPLCNFTGWLIITDDYYDEDSVGKQIENIVYAFDRFKMVLDFHQPKDPTKIELALRDVAEQIKALNPEMYVRFQQDCCNYWDACVTEAIVRKKQEPVTKEFYLSYRIATLAMDMLYDFIVPGKELQASVIDHPLVSQVRHLASKIITVQNDILSFPKEFAHNDPNNYLACLKMESGISNEEALIRSVNEHNRLIEEFVALTSENNLAQIADCEAACYAAAMRPWVSGVFDWHLLSGRYHYLNNSNTVISAPLPRTPAESTLLN
jgi:hypothetical protein